MKKRLRQIMIAILCCLILPVGEAHCEETKRFSALQIHEIMRHVQPYLEEQGCLESCPEHAILAWGDTLYIHVDFSEMIEMTEQGIVPDTVYSFHNNPDCVPGPINKINIMTLHFWETDQAFQPCPVCFPEGVKLLISANETRNGKINLTIGRYDSLQNDLYDSSKIIVQLGAEDYSAEAVSHFAGLSKHQSRHDPDPIYHPCYLAEPYQSAQYAEACPECYGGNFLQRYWEALDSDWIYCTICGSVWNAEGGRTLAQY